MARPRKASVQSKPPGSQEIAVGFEADGTFAKMSLEDFFGFGITDAVFRGNVLSFDWVLDDETNRAVHLTNLDGTSYSGTSVQSRGTQHQQFARIEGVLFMNSKGRVLLAQAVYDDGSEESWVIRFYVERPLPS